MTMKMMARTNQKSYLNNYKGETWTEVKSSIGFYPGGCRETITFPDGFKCRIDKCEVIYVFDK